MEQVVQDLFDDIMEGERFEKRKQRAERMKAANKGRVPVFARRSPKSEMPELRKSKLLVPIECTMGQFLHIIRKSINLLPEEGLFIFINNSIPSSSATIGELYEQFHKEDQFLYITYNGESVYGGI